LLVAFDLGHAGPEQRQGPVVDPGLSPQVTQLSLVAIGHSRPVDASLGSVGVYFGIVGGVGAVGGVDAGFFVRAQGIPGISVKRGFGPIAGLLIRRRRLLR